MNTRQEQSYKQALQTAQEKFDGEVSRLAEQIRQEIIIPLCRTHKLRFTSGMGTFFFTDEKGRGYTSDVVDRSYAGTLRIKRAVAPVFKLLNEEVSHNQCLGYFVCDVP